MKNSKKWYQSMTVWGGVLLALAGLITGLGQLFLGEIDMQMFLASVLVFGKGVWDVYNRFKTNKLIQ